MLDIEKLLDIEQYAFGKDPRDYCYAVGYRYGLLDSEFKNPYRVDDPRGRYAAWQMGYQDGIGDRFVN